jgi:hypothetical protein
MKNFIIAVVLAAVTYYTLSELSDIRLLFSIIIYSIVHNELRVCKLEKEKK